MSEWGQGASIGTIYLYNNKLDEGRIGHCQFKPADGDLCLCVEHSGDYFYDYIAIRRSGRKWKAAGRFGAYVFGQSIAKTNERQFCLLQEGLAVALPQIKIK